jgi:hypothetical protein
MGYSHLLQLVRNCLRWANCSGNIWENADQWRHLSPSEAATGAGDIYALLEYEKQGQTSNLLALHRGTRISYAI